MVNYAFIDTGPPVSPKQKNPPDKQVNCLARAGTPPGSPPTYREEPPPDFFETGNRLRWLLLLLPFVSVWLPKNEISPHLPDPNPLDEFSTVFFFCCATITYLALKAKRRKLFNLLHSEPTAYYTEQIRLAYNKPSNTSLIPLLFTATELYISIFQVVTFHNFTPLLFTFSSFILFLILFQAHGFDRCVAEHRASLTVTPSKSNKFQTLKTQFYE